MPRLPIDYWVICDDTHAYLFFTGDNGRLYRSRTKIEDFPRGMSDPEIAIEETRETLFEGSMTYKIKGTDKYLTLVEGLGPSRYYRAYTADRLDGEWTPVPDADTYEDPFAGINNVRFEKGVEPWTRDISHGELIRDGYDETLTIDPKNLQMLYQGRDPASGGPYHALPYRLGLLKLDKSARQTADQRDDDDEDPPASRQTRRRPRAFRRPDRAGPRRQAGVRRPAGRLQRRPRRHSPRQAGDDRVRLEVGRHAPQDERVHAARLLPRPEVSRALSAARHRRRRN